MPGFLSGSPDIDLAHVFTMECLETADTRGCSRVAFRALWPGHGERYVAAETGDQGWRLVANRNFDAPRSWETFTLIDLRNGRVGFRTHHRRYVSSAYPMVDGSSLALGNPEGVELYEVGPDHCYRY